MYIRLSNTKAPKIYTDSGYVNGITVAENSAGGTKLLRSKYFYPTVQYLGIPYASPPIGKYRWQKPQPPDRWSDVLNCTAYKPICPQNLNSPYLPRNLLPKVYDKMLEYGIQDIINNSLESREDKMSEDCLYLNIIVPAKFYKIINPEAPNNYLTRLPVMIHVHGYSWSEGAASWFDPAPISAIGDVIVVNFNYRLGPLGFLKFENLESNYGLHDQITAIQWVKNNIANFGGDETKITLFGSGAGAVSINNLQLSDYGNIGLYKRMILQSGTAISPFAKSSMQNIEAHGNFIKMSGCGNFDKLADRIDCMRKKSWQDLFLKMGDRAEWEKNFPINTLIFGPTVDNKLILANASSLQDSGEFLSTDLLIGINISDGKRFTYKVKANEPDPAGVSPFNLAIDFITSTTPNFTQSKRSDVGKLIQTFYRVYDDHLTNFKFDKSSGTNLLSLHNGLKYAKGSGNKSQFKIMNLFTDYQYIAPFYKQIKNQQTYGNGGKI